MCVVMDRYTGEVLDPAESGPGEVFTHWQWPVHSGQAFGWPRRVLVFLTGLICPVTFATGMIRWLQKRRASQRSVRCAHEVK
ncbi:MAG: PepSY domain-containing protein [Burkholderiales bacterium]